jgi:hypothetical protein
MRTNLFQWKVPEHERKLMCVLALKLVDGERRYSRVPGFEVAATDRCDWRIGRALRVVLRH